MTTQFQVHVDARGDFWVADGTLIDRSNGAIWPVGDGDPAGSSLTGEEATNLSETVEVPAVTEMVLVGGSGANVILSGAGAPLDGVYRPGRPGTWVKGIFTIVVTGPSDALLNDESQAVAELMTGGTAPVGAFESTAYGEETYTSDTPFTLTAVAETGWPGGLVDLAIEISEGTATGGSFTAVDAASFVSETDANWTLDLEASGRAALKYLGDEMAVREGGPVDDPCGEYTSTEAGALMNPVFPDEEDWDFPVENPFGLLELQFDWAGAPDLDIGVEFLDFTAGYGHGNSNDYVTWDGDNTTDGGPETVTVDLGLAWENGEISTQAEVLAMADWFPSAGGSGPATLTVTYKGGAPVVHTIHPKSATPAETPALALLITPAGVSVVGEEWTARVKAVRRPPVAGVVYIEVTEVAGVVTAVAGPFFAAAMPAPAGDMVPFPLASSDGAGGLKQHHQGPLVWI